MHQCGIDKSADWRTEADRILAHLANENKGEAA